MILFQNIHTQSHTYSHTYYHQDMLMQVTCPACRHEDVCIHAPLSRIFCIDTVGSRHQPSVHIQIVNMSFCSFQKLTVTSLFTLTHLCEPSRFTYCPL